MFAFDKVKIYLKYTGLSVYHSKTVRAYQDTGYFTLAPTFNGSRGSSVSIVSGYGTDDRAIEVRSLAEARGFFLWPLCLRPTQPPVQWVPGVLYPGVKRGRGVTLTIHPIYCRGREWVGAILLSLLRLHRCVAGLFHPYLCSILHLVV
jgi:hypothetical protein